MKYNASGKIGIIDLVKDKKFKLAFSLFFILFAYWLGILQDFYYAAIYFIILISTHKVEGSFPFMLGWTILMLWGVIKPLERRWVLLLTSALVLFMFIEKVILFVGGENREFPFINIIGFLLWSSSYYLAGLLPHKITENNSRR
jgi:hypothetical protein